jgi:hypothetical protein
LAATKCVTVQELLEAATQQQRLTAKLLLDLTESQGTHDQILLTDGSDSIHITLLATTSEQRKEFKCAVVVGIRGVYISEIVNNVL